MAPGGEMIRYPPHFGENVLHHGSHEWLPYSKDEVRLKSSNNNLLGCRIRTVWALLPFSLPKTFCPGFSFAFPCGILSQKG